MNCKKTPFPDEFMGTVFCCVKLFNDLWVNVSLHYYLLWYYYCLQYCYLHAAGVSVGSSGRMLPGSSITSPGVVSGSVGASVPGC